MLPKPEEETVLSLLQEDLVFWMFKTLRAAVGFNCPCQPHPRDSTHHFDQGTQALI